MTGKPIRVLVADDHMIVRTGIRHVVESEPDFEVVGEAASGSEALSLASRLRPDVVVLDISMPDQSGLEVAASLRSIASPPRVLILSMHDNPEYVLESVRAGAHGYLLKDTAGTELRNAIRAVCRGESYFSLPVASRLSAAVRGEQDNHHPWISSPLANGRCSWELSAAIPISRSQRIWVSATERSRRIGKA